MRTTVRIADDLMMLLKAQAHKEGVPVGDVLNRCVRRGLEASRQQRRNSTKSHREQVFSMGEPAVSLTKALAIAATLEDEETLEKLARRK